MTPRHARHLGNPDRFRRHERRPRTHRSLQLLPHGRPECLRRPRHRRVRSESCSTITGGLTFGGGPGNNYVTHSIASMVDRLRSDSSSQGLVTALGWFCTKHSWGVYSSSPPRDGFRWAGPQDKIDRQARCASDQRDGPATVESYTVTHSSNGEPERLIIAARTPDDVRTWCHSTEATLMEESERTELIGRAGEVRSDVFAL